MPRKQKTEEQKAMTPLAQAMDQSDIAVNAFRDLVQKIADEVVSGSEDDNGNGPVQLRRTATAMIAQYAQVEIARLQDAASAEMEAEIKRLIARQQAAA